MLQCCSCNILFCMVSIKVSFSRACVWRNQRVVVHALLVKMAKLASLEPITGGRGGIGGQINGVRRRKSVPSSKHTNIPSPDPFSELWQSTLRQTFFPAASLSSCTWCLCPGRGWGERGQVNQQVRTGLPSSDAHAPPPPPPISVFHFLWSLSPVSVSTRRVIAFLAPP